MRDLGVRQAARDQPEHFALARGQIVEPREFRLRLWSAALDELGYDAARDRRREERLAGSDDLDRRDELLGRRVLEQEPAGTCAQRLVDVLITVERGEHQDARRLAAGDAVRDDPPRGLETVELGHADVHQHDVGTERPDQVDRVAAVRRFADDLDLGLGVEDHAEPGAHECLVVDEQHADHDAASTGSCARTR